MTTNAWEGVIDYDAPGPEGDDEDEPAVPEVKLYPYAGGIRRFLAYGLWDTGIVVFTILAWSTVLDRNMLLLVGAAVIAVYFIVGYRIGATPGLWIMGTRVVRADDADRHLTWGQASERLGVFAVEMFVFPPILLLMYTNPQRQTLHDKAAGSVVIRVRRTYKEMLQNRRLGQ